MSIMRTVVTFLSTALLFAAIPASAQECKGHQQDGGKHKMWADLNLTEDQKTKLKDLHKEMIDLRKGQMEKMKALHEKNKEELLKANPSKTTLYNYAKEMGDFHRTMAEKRVDHLLKVKSVLTPEQFNKMIEKQGMNAQGKMRGMKGAKGMGMHGKNGCAHHGAETPAE